MLVDGLRDLGWTDGTNCSELVWIISSDHKARRSLLTTLSVSNSYTDNWNANGGGIGTSTVRSNVVGYTIGGGAEYSLAKLDVKGGVSSDRVWFAYDVRYMAYKN